MTRRWLLVIEDPRAEIDSEEAADAYFRGLIDDPTSPIRVARVQRGGLLADRVMGELPPPRRGSPKDRG